MTNSLFFFIAAICVFVIAAVIAFIASGISLVTLVGIVAIGLACFVVGHAIP